MTKIITDCDGVLLDWCFAFDVWMSEQGYLRLPDTDQYFDQTRRYGINEREAIDCVQRFNESGSVGYLPAYRDSVEYVSRLADLGYRFEVISSLHIDQYAQHLRKRNLVHLFGDVFDYINCSLDFTRGKKYILEQRYASTGYYWLEDNVTHAQAGADVGMRACIFDHPYNQNCNLPRVRNWREFYQLVTNDSSS